MHRYLERFVIVVAVLVTIAIGFGIFGWSGLYNLGADAHHTKPVLAYLTMARNRSLDVHSANIKVPNLDNRQLILKGAGQYSAMCTSCHLAPGMNRSELRAGLYPQPPNLSNVRFTPQREFWAIKHGIKMSAMPAWGYTHNDPTIWSMVAFLQKLPDMTPAQYKAIVAIAPPDEDMDMDKGGGGHSHAHGKPDHDGDHTQPASGMSAMPGMAPQTRVPAHAGTSGSQ